MVVWERGRERMKKRLIAHNAILKQIRQANAR